MVMIKDHKHYITLILTLILFSIVNKKVVDNFQTDNYQSPFYFINLYT